MSARATDETEDGTEVSPLAAEIEFTGTTAEAILEVFGKGDPLEDNGDYLADVPFHALDPAPFNPKKKIVGKYKRGLATSFHVFKVSDTFKVWPNPKVIGRFYIIDGNQRFDVLREEVEDFLISREAARIELGNLPGPGETLITVPEVIKRMKATYQAVFADPAQMAEIRSQVGAVVVECRVKPHLSPDEAKLFTASFNRNHAAFDEFLLADLMDSLTVPDDIIKRLARPDRPFVAPVQQMLPATVFHNPDLANPEVTQATEDEPWGPPPAIPQPRGILEAAGFEAVPKRAKGPLVPRMYSFTPDAIDKLTSLEGIMRTRSRETKATRFIEIIENFINILEKIDIDRDKELIDHLVEIAHLCGNDRLAIREDEANMVS